MTAIDFRRTAVLTAVGMMGIAGHSLAAELVVRADTVVEINGQSLIPDGLFGITAYNGAEAACSDIQSDLLKRSGIRWAGLPAHAEWLLPAEAPPDFASGWADTPAAGALLDRLGKGYPIPRCVKGWRDLGIEPMLYLLGVQGIFKWPDREAGATGNERPKNMPPLFPLTPRDIERAALEWAEYVALVRRADPGLTWLHLDNEPNAHWFRFGKGGADYAALFKVIAAKIKARNPGVKIGGPVLCWPPSFPSAQKGQASWYTWKQWAEPLIEMAGEELDFFDFHLYSAKTSTLGLEEVQTVSNALWLKTRQRKPILITEYGAYLKDEDMRSAERVWDLRVVPWQSQVMDFLDFQPDRVVSLQPHDLFAQAGGNFRFIKGNDPDDQFSLYKQYQVWAPLSGRRLLATSSDPAVRVFAATKISDLTGKARFSVVAVNTSDEAKNVSLLLSGGLSADVSAPVKCAYVRLADFSGRGCGDAAEEGLQKTELGGAVGGGEAAPAAVPAGGKDNPEVAQISESQADRSRVESGAIISDGPLATFVLAARETRSFDYVLSKPAEPSLKRWTRDVFGDVVHRDFEKVGDAIEVAFDVNGVETDGADKAMVRIGLLGAREGDQVSMRLGDFTCQLGQQDWFQNVSLPAVPRDRNVKAVFTLVARGAPDVRPLLLRFGSATLAFEGTRAFTPRAMKAPSAAAPVVDRWSLASVTGIVSRLENPWRVSSQSVSNSRLDQHRVDKGIPVSNQLVAVVDGGIRKSACEALTFRVPKNGWYRIATSGKLLTRSSPTAGNALVTLYVLGSAGKEYKELASFPLNTPDGYGHYPHVFEWKGTLQLCAGWTFALGLQTVSPGPGNAGLSKAEVADFDVEELDAER